VILLDNVGKGVGRKISKEWGGATKKVRKVVKNTEK